MVSSTTALSKNGTMEHSVSTISDQQWNVLIPIKSLDLAKSRLTLSKPTGSDRNPNALLAEAFAADVISAAANCDAVASVIVVSRDLQIAELASELGAQVITEPAAVRDGLSPLNSAITVAVEQILAQPPASTSPTQTQAVRGELPLAVVAGDLPCLTPQALSQVLAAATAELGRSFVADHSGSGTAMLCVVDPAACGLDPRFGQNSAQAHTASGATPLVAGVPLAARLDVDTSADLARAVAADLGVTLGAKTAKVLQSLNRSTFNG